MLLKTNVTNDIYKPPYYSIVYQPTNIHEVEFVSNVNLACFCLRIQNIDNINTCFRK